MILKSKSRKTKSFKQLLNYLMDDKGRGLSDDAFIITHNVKGEEVKDWVQSLEKNEQMKGKIRKNAVRVIHDIMAFHEHDSLKISSNVLQDIAYQYIEKRNPNGMYIIIPHLEDDHLHIHVCASPWEYLGGKSLRMSKAEFRELKNEIEEFQQEKYPELLYSRIEHGKTKIKNLGRNPTI